MNEETTAAGDAGAGSAGLAGRGGRVAAAELRQLGTISCRECGDEGVRDDHAEQPVVACPSCREILYRPVEATEPAL